MKRSKKRLLALFLAVLIIAGILPFYAIANDAGIVEMVEFLGMAKILDLGEAIANKVVTEKLSNPGVFDIELYVAGRNGVPKSYGTDIVFVIDTSSSMSSTDIRNARNSVIEAIDTLFKDPEVGNKSRVAIVVFNNWVTIGNFNQGSSGGARYWTTSATWESSDRSKVDSTSTGRLSSGNFWSTADRTNTQAGIHAGHYLLQDTNKPAPPSINYTSEDNYDGSFNTKVMVVMTDGGPNKYYNYTANTVTYNDSGTNRDIINPTRAPSLYETSSWWAGGSLAQGDDASANRAIWQAKYAQIAGISMYAIGYGNYFQVDSTTGKLTGNSVATKTLEGIAPRFFTASGDGAGAALTDIMKGISKSSAARLNNLQVVDLIGNGFVLEGSLGTVEKALFDSDSTLGGLTWIPLTPDEAITNNAILQGSNSDTVQWSLGSVDDFTIYRLVFQVKIKDDLNNGVYYTNTNVANDFVQAQAGQRSYQTGQHNKLTYTFDGDDGSYTIYACEKYTVSNEKPATIYINKAISASSDSFIGNAPNFSFAAYLDENCTVSLSGITEIEVSGGTIVGSGTTTIVIKDILPLIPNGQSSVDLWIKESGTQTLANGGRWDHDANVVKISVSDKGVVTYPVGTAVPFTNTFTKLYTVTVNYYVFNKVSGTYNLVHTESESSFENGDSYAMYAQDLFRNVYGVANAPFSYSSSSAKTGEIAINKDEYDILVNDVIKSENVVINLYYIGTADIDIWLTKSISLAESTMIYPQNYSFTFTLNNGVKDVATLVFDQGDFTSANSSTKQFTWLNGVDYQTDLEGKILFISESFSGKWSSSLIGSVDFVKIENGIATSIYQSTNGNQVDNLYTQDPVPATVNLHKYFEGNLSSLVNQEYDGSSLDCGLIHSHNEDCYVYTFNFTLIDKDANVVDSDSLQLTKTQLIGLSYDPATSTSFVATWTSLSFTIPANSVKNGPFSISENSQSGAYWSLGASVSGIIVNPYTGVVTYPDGLTVVEMTNIFQGTNRPDLTFSKQVIDARTGGIAGGYNGTFNFELFDGSSSLGIYTIDVVNGQGTLGEIIKLYGYINKTANLSLYEIKPDPSSGDLVEGMDYDLGPYTVEIVNGQLVSQQIVFENVYMEPIDPEFSIVKTTNAADKNATFAFEYSYVEDATNQTDCGYVEITTQNGTGTQKITGFLPTNFSGTVTVIETHIVSQVSQDEVWILDTVVKTLVYKDGVCTSPSNLVSFANSLWKPDISIAKEYNTASVVEPGTNVTYTLTVVNSGDEKLTDVEIADSMFSDNMVFDKICLNGIDLVEGIDYEYINKKLIFDELNKGDVILIVYTIKYDAIGFYTNNADVKAYGSDTKREVSSNAVESITVKIADLGGAALTVTKKVSLYRAAYPIAASPAYVFEDSVAFSSSGNRAIFQITVTNNSSWEITLDSVTDTYAGAGVNISEFVLEDGSPIDLTAYPLAASSSISFYYITAAITSTGTYRNSIDISAYVTLDNSQILNDGDFADVNASWSSGYYVPPVRPSNPPPEIEEIVEEVELLPEPMPLVETPPEEDPMELVVLGIPGLQAEPGPSPEDFVEIIDPDVPITNLPQTGIPAILPFVLLALGTATLSLGLMLPKKRKER
ncbi:MAG: VWA domain-containing protein [Oscillospiraceae bacterium]|nr:VWA domain-containing protein [Oscillospiraceae bacterium]